MNNLLGFLGMQSSDASGSEKRPRDSSDADDKASKRRRFVDFLTGSTSSAGAGAAAAGAEAGVSAAEDEDPLVCEANKALQLALVSSEDDVAAPTWFHPEYTHQVFSQEETIFGYANLSVRIVFASASMYAWIDMSYDRKVEGAQDVIADITAWLPEDGWTTDKQEFLKQLRTDNSAWSPMGKSLALEGVDDAAGHAGRFVVTVGAIDDAPGLEAWHRRVQALIPFFIDAGSCIAFDSRWTFFHLLHRPSPSSAWSVVGFCTAYRFYHHVDKERLRIAQFMLLPTWQKKGLGTALLRTIYAYALAEDKIAQVTVEDPADAFVGLRDFVDMSRLQQAGLLGFGLPRALLDPDVSKDQLAQQTSDLKAWLTKAEEMMKMPRSQARRCFEIATLAALGVDFADDEAMKPFRLMIKRRLNRKCEEVLSTLEDADKKKEQLQQMYQVLHDEYTAVLKRMHRQA